MPLSLYRRCPEPANRELGPPRSAVLPSELKPGMVAGRYTVLALIAPGLHAALFRCRGEHVAGAQIVRHVSRAPASGFRPALFDELEGQAGLTLEILINLARVLTSTPLKPRESGGL
ncbi:hypothetical protein BV25DRAFT_1028389 [Artomyces pyxidatus]|uniref:Uncharacterized protein n=1 Tax=Artomyces pyxidatus TaxID=48021 RepID=A0ACB8SUF4_9AGAM|nr:hypothetical protein BV25DRAFT_1028389 [Artomyces pyxidatus]